MCPDTWMVAGLPILTEKWRVSNVILAGQTRYLVRTAYYALYITIYHLSKYAISIRCIMAMVHDTWLVF